MSGQEDFFFDPSVRLGPIVGDIQNKKAVIVMCLKNEFVNSYFMKWWFDNNKQDVLQSKIKVVDSPLEIWSRFEIDLKDNAKICYYQIVLKTFTDNPGGSGFIEKEKALTSVLSFACPQENVPLKMAVVSCNNVPRYSVTKQFEDIYNQNPQILVHLGDQVYLDDLFQNLPKNSDVLKFDYLDYVLEAYQKNFNRKEQRICMATRSNIILYDDHEFTDDVNIRSTNELTMWIQNTSLIAIQLSFYLMNSEVLNPLIESEEFDKYPLYIPRFAKNLLYNSPQTRSYLSRKLKWNNNELWILDVFSDKIFLWNNNEKKMLSDPNKKILDQWKNEYLFPNNVFILTQRPLLYGTVWVNVFLSKKIPSVQAALKDTWDGPNGKDQVVGMLDFCKSVAQKMSTQSILKYPIWVGGDVHEYLDTTVDDISSFRQILEQVVSSPLSSPPAFSGKYGGWKETLFDWISVKSSQYFKFVVGSYFISRIKTVRERNWVLFNCPSNAENPSHIPFFYPEVLDAYTANPIVISNENLWTEGDYKTFEENFKGGLIDTNFIPLSDEFLKYFSELLKNNPEFSEKISQFEVDSNITLFKNEKEFVNILMNSKVGPKIDYLPLLTFDLELWFPFISKLTNLTRLSLSDNKLTDKNLPLLLESLPPSITSLQLSYNTDVSDVTPLVQYLKEHPKITLFHFKSNAKNQNLLDAYLKEHPEIRY